MAHKNGDCYIDVWRDADLRGETVRIYGPAEYASLDFAQGRWGDDIGSLRVGPNAFVMARHRRDFRGRLITFGPNDEVADLGQLKSDDEVESMKVIDSLKIFDRLADNSAPPPERPTRARSAASPAPTPTRAGAGRAGGARRPPSQARPPASLQARQAARQNSDDTARTGVIYEVTRRA